MSDQAARDLIDIDARLFAAKGSLDNLYQELAEFLYPERADFTQELILGQEYASHLTDATPVLMRRELGDQIGSMTRPDGRQWFKAAAANKYVSRDRSAAAFLEFMTDVNAAILNSRDSGFRRAAQSVEHDFATFGMGWMQVSYNKTRDNLMFRCHHPKKMAGQEGPDGLTNQAHRKETMTAQTLAHLFGESRLPQKVKDALKQKDTKTTFNVRHCFIPLDRYDPYRKFPKWAKWADVYVLIDGAVILQELPSTTFDYVVPRWHLLSDKFYAVSTAASIGLTESRMLQRMKMTIIEAGEKQVDPPLVATQDAILSPIDLSANGITFIDSEYDERLGQALRPLDLGKNTGLGVDLINDQRRQIADAFFLSKLQPIASAEKTMTAYEAAQRVQEWIRNALPLFGPIEHEWTGAVLELTTEKVMRAGGYGPVDRNGVPVDMPDALLGQSITYEFNNALKEARDRQTLNAFQESAGILQAGMSLDPSLGGEIDSRTMFRDAFAAVPNGRSDWLVDAEQAAIARQQTQQAMAEQQQIQQVGQVADVAGRAGDAALSVQQALAS